MLIYYDSYDEMNAKKANPLDVPEISDEVSMIVNTVQQMLNLTPESFESFSQYAAVSKSHRFRAA